MGGTKSMRSNLDREVVLYNLIARKQKISDDILDMSDSLMHMCMHILHLYGDPSIFIVITKS